MKMTLAKMTKVAAGSIMAILASGAASAQTQQPDWHFSLTPYLWLPSFDFELKYGPPPQNEPSANVEGDEDDFLNMLEGAFMISGEARKGPWFVFTDYLYIHLADMDSNVKSVDFNPGSDIINISSSQIGGNVETSVKGSIWTLAGGRAIVDGPSARLDILVGLRYLDLEFSSAWTLDASITLPNSTQTFEHAGDADKSGSLTNVIVGAKGHFNLGDSPWFVPYYADIGGDNGTFTWQLSSGVGYHLGWGDVRLDYRHLAYEQDDDKLIQHAELSGFAVVAVIDF